MKNWKRSLPILLLLATAFATPAAYAQSQPPPPSSAESSRTSDIRASDGVIAACNAAVDELRATRVLVESLDAENKILRERLKTEKRTASVLTELNETRKSEAEALRKTIDAKNETLAAKDAVIDAQEKLIASLKSKRRSPLARLGDILLGAAVIAILK
jgi:hypothetical protein